MYSWPLYKNDNSSNKQNKQKKLNKITDAVPLALDDLLVRERVIKIRMQIEE